MQFFDYFKKFEPHIFRFWEILTPEQKRQFEEQLRQIDLETLQKQKDLIAHPAIVDASTIEPFQDFEFSGNVSYQKEGQRLIEKGNVGALILAGGQGTRLGHPGPKGTYPISVVHNKSLFQLCAEKVLAASHRANRPLQLAIMTSKENDEETRTFFSKHHFFGLSPSQVYFFVQKSLPFLNASGNLFLHKPWQIGEGANGNGGSLLHLVQSGILQNWFDQGIEMITVIPVDNPLADPFDAQFIGFHSQKKNEISLKCTEKTDPDEKVGVLVKRGGKCEVIEYTELSEDRKIERESNGKLKHCCANLGLFCFSLSFIQKIAEKEDLLPLHRAWKKLEYIDDQGIIQTPSTPNGWKFETFIFDWLPFSDRVSALLYSREECFAPLKNKTGNDSPETVRLALQNRDRVLWQKATPLPCPEPPFELPTEYLYS